jgi:hypothetical protein
VEYVRVAVSRRNKQAGRLCPRGWKLTLLLREPFLKKREHGRFLCTEIA